MSLNSYEFQSFDSFVLKMLTCGCLASLSRLEKTDQNRLSKTSTLAAPVRTVPSVLISQISGREIETTKTRALHGNPEAYNSGYVTVFDRTQCVFGQVKSPGKRSMLIAKIGVAISAPDSRWKNSVRVEVVLADLFPFLLSRPSKPGLSQRDSPDCSKEIL